MAHVCGVLLIQENSSLLFLSNFLVISVSGVTGKGCRMLLAFQQYLVSCCVLVPCRKSFGRNSWIFLFAQLIELDTFCTQAGAPFLFLLKVFLEVLLNSHLAWDLCV